MRINRKYIAEFFERLFRNKFFMTVYADSGEDGNDDIENDNPHEGAKKTSGTPQINFEELIKQARKEEKDKLYKRTAAIEDKEKSAAANLNKPCLKTAH